MTHSVPRYNSYGARPAYALYKELEDVDWTLFDKEGPEWLNARTAWKLCHTAITNSDNDKTDNLDPMDWPRLPKVARYHYNKSRNWRVDFLECYSRIACRLMRGLEPSPNCTGDEMALQNIISLASAFDGDGMFDEMEEDGVFKIPKDRKDDGSAAYKSAIWDEVRDLAIQDEDVLGT